MSGHPRGHHRWHRTETLGWEHTARGWSAIYRYACHDCTGTAAASTAPLSAVR